ncbi:MAG: ribulokinase [Clostridia bacterium]|nr:ribulokinase [Clostridia bacterium]
MAKYVIGIDYGTLSARALVCEVGTGRELGEGVFEYPHAVMDEHLPDGTPLPPDWALEHPQDYLDALYSAIPEALKNAGVDKDDVIGLGIDFTACTLMPIDKNGDPLSDKYPSRPHAYVKLWKHHAAQEQANRLNRIAEERGEKWLKRYGGKISSEWMFPKLMQTAEEDPELFKETDRFMEAGDWVILRMTGQETRSSCMAGYKAIWSKREGYPSKEFLKQLNPLLENVVEEKLGKVTSIGSKAGELTEEMAAKLGLNPGTAVAVCNVDAHVSLPPAGLTQKGSMLMVMGTSSCHIMLGDEEKIVPGMCGVVEDGVVPGLFGYEAGQSCLGDHYNWFVDNCVPEAYEIAAREKGMNTHQYLTSLAEKQKPGESGLLALDWWNGNRSVLVDVDLTGMMLGMTLTTKPEEIYRALIEATAYGTRIIIDTFEENGVKIDKLFACGGISQKNPFLMQLFADVLKREIRIARSTQTPALGSAMFGAVAAGKAKGGYDSIEQAAEEMGGALPTVYAPNAENGRIYDELYSEYRRLHDYFGRGENDVMKRLKDIRRRQRA